MHRYVAGDMKCKVVSLHLTRLSKLPQWLRLLTCRLFLQMRAHSRDWMVMSMDMADHTTLRTILGPALPFYSRLLPSGSTHYLGWGRKWSGERAVAIAKLKGSAFQLVEDRF